MRIAIIFDNLGPYHLARLRGAIAACGSFGVVGLEVRAKSAEYEWEVAAKSFDVEFQTVLPSRAKSWTLWFRIRAVWQHLDQLQPQAVAIAGYASPEMLSALGWCRRENRIAILLSESKASDTARSLWKEKVKGLVVRRYHAAVVGGRPQRRYLESMGFPVGAIFSGYDVVENAVYHPDRISNLARPIDHPYFLMINRFVPKKNLNFALECYAEYRHRVIARNGRPWDLVMVGDGPLRSDLCRLASDFSLNEHVHFPGFLQQIDLSPYLAHCEAFLHASTVEQWGLVVNEAMAAGRPVFVSRRCGCFEDLIEEGRTGMGFDPTNREELIQLMVKATRGELPLTSLGSAALKHISNFTPLHFGQSLKQAVEYGSRRISSPSGRR